MTSICIPIFIKPGVNLEETIDEAEDALDGTRGMLELRCDLATPRLMLEAIEFAHLPVIVTVRPTWEGGLCEKDDEYRIGLWEAAIEAGVEFIDVELLAWEKNRNVRDRICEAAEKSGTRIILSTHSFDGRPKDLDSRVARLRRIKQADILKIVWKADSILDAITALNLLDKLRKEDRRPAVVLAMGEEGLLSRILAKKCGAAFTFATLAPGLESAPGQTTVHDLRHLYRWDHQTPDSPLYAVAGFPIAHSKSPAIHNSGFDALHLPGIYVPLLIKPSAFPAVIDALRQIPSLNLRGLSVTIPHKEAAFKYVVDHNGKIDDLSRRIGVLNTLLWSGDTLKGFNSDYEGALDALTSAWSGRREDLASKRIAVIGAGGVARSVVAGLITHGASVIIYNRTRERADALAADFADTQKVLAADWANLPTADCDAYIQCTPLGMFPNIDSSPLSSPPANWAPGIVVFDTVYNPPLTKFLQLAQSTGATLIPGTEMFLRQAAAQFQAFTQHPAPLDAFRKALS